VTRREFLAALGWFPFFWRRRVVSLAGARFRVIRNGRSGHRYLVIHGNEETARRVLFQHIRDNPGTAYEVEGHRRNVPVSGGVIDPNRMFSRTGAENSLRHLNPEWAPDRIAHALDELDKGRERLLTALLPPEGGRLLVFHNNSEGYSVQDELAISDRSCLPEPANPHAFFLCTNPSDFAILAGSPYNVVLQQSGPKEDDGSLSRQAARRGLRYINLEVRLGSFERQAQMAIWLENHLP